MYWFPDQQYTSKLKQENFCFFKAKFSEASLRLRAPIVSKILWKNKDKIAVLVGYRG